MRFLIDTHVLLWWLFDTSLLNKAAKSIISNTKNQIFVSVLSPWEIFIKEQKGKLKTPGKLLRELKNEDFSILPVSEKHLPLFRQLPSLHSDPFDRMLIAQAKSEEMTLITRDKQILQYDVEAIKA